MSDEGLRSANKQIVFFKLLLISHETQKTYIPYFQNLIKKKQDGEVWDSEVLKVGWLGARARGWWPTSQFFPLLCDVRNRLNYSDLAFSENILLKKYWKWHRHADWSHGQTRLCYIDIDIKAKRDYWSTCGLMLGSTMWDTGSPHTLT